MGMLLAVSMELYTTKLSVGDSNAIFLVVGRLSSSSMDSVLEFHVNNLDQCFK